MMLRRAALRLWKRKWIRPAVVALVCLGLAERAAADDELSAALEAEMAKMECPGALVGVRVGAQPAQVLALGVADIKTKAPIERDFHMRIGSVTKPFVGTAVLLLADEKKLAVEDTIAKYVDGVPQGDKITLVQLANHTSGLFNPIEDRDFQEAIMAAPERPWPGAEILKVALARPAYGPPGERWHYSNAGAVLLGEVIEKVTGMPYAEFVRQRVLAPLELTQTGFAEGPSLPKPAPSGYRNGREHRWIGYGRVFVDVTPYSAAWTGAAGNMYSTIDDLLRAAQPIATGKLLGEDSRRVLHAWVPTTTPGMQYGFCLVQDDGWLSHFGDVPGFAGFMGYLPAKDASLVVLTNLSNDKTGRSPAERLRDVVIERLDLKAE
jgi:D-alanyl-D-alanine carboxypeptidase